MKRNLFTLSLIGFITLTGCGGNNSSDTPKEKENKREQYAYRLEKGEEAPTYKFFNEDMLELKASKMSISGISTLYSDPYSYAYFMNEGSIRYPSAEMLKGKSILYTSNWYSRYTFNRNDPVTEYVLVKEGKYWIVEDISNKAETYIPLNGAVLSIPSSSSTKYDIGDTVNISNDSIATDFQLAFYNPNTNKRLGIKCVNDSSWVEKEINMYDENTLATATRGNYDRLISMNVVYDKKAKKYYVDKFRNVTKQTSVYTNVSEGGFALFAAPDKGNECVKLMDSALFSENDVLVAENGGAIHEKTIKINTGSNKYYLSDGKVLNFNLTKTTVATTQSRWGTEVGVDKNGYIVSTGCHVTIPNGGYKFALTVSGSTNGEDLNKLTECVFLLGSKVYISGSTITISQSTIERANKLWSIIALNYETVLYEDIACNNYDYNEEKVAENYEKLSHIREEIDSLCLEEEPDLYRVYSLTGAMYQLYYQLLGYTNRNEAVQSKACWYIENYTKGDANLEAVQDHLKLIKDSGTNEIIVYAVDDGKVGYSNSKYFEETTAASKNDYGEYGHDFLKALIGEAHKLNIKVQAVFCPFTSGIENAFTDIKDCIALNVDGKNKVTTSQGSVSMLDPSNDKVQEKIKLTIEDLLTCNPGLDGIQLDYIRYGADNNSINTTMGITTSSMQKYNEAYKTNYTNLDAFRTDLKKGGTVFSNFMICEQNFITNTVKNIKEVCKKYNAPLSCAVADDYNSTKSWKSQDWAKWAKDGIVDALYLMDYYFDEYYVNYYYKDMLTNTKNSCLLITGIDPSYAGLSDEYYARTIKGGVNDYHSSGYAIFGSHTQDSKKYGWDLIQDSNWIDSVSPYDSLSVIINASSTKLLERCDSLYIKYNNQTETQKENLKNDLDELISFASSNSYEAATNAMNKLTSMLEKTYASNEANNRIKEQLEYMFQLARYKQNVFKE